MGLQRSWKIPLKILDPREIDDLNDTLEKRILEKVKEDFISKMELIKNEIKRTIVVVPRNVGTNDLYEELVEYFDVT